MNEHIQSRDADDPKLAQFYYTVTNKLDMLCRHYEAARRSAVVRIDYNTDNMSELAVLVGELTRNMTSLSILATVQNIFNTAWQALNAVEDDANENDKK